MTDLLGFLREIATCDQAQSDREEIGWQCRFCAAFNTDKEQLGHYPNCFREQARTLLSALPPDVAAIWKRAEEALALERQGRTRTKAAGALLPTLASDIQTLLADRLQLESERQRAQQTLAEAAPELAGIRERWQEDRDRMNGLRPGTDSPAISHDDVTTLLSICDLLALTVAEREGVARAAHEAELRALDERDAARLDARRWETEAAEHAQAHLAARKELVALLRGQEQAFLVATQRSDGAAPKLGKALGPRAARGGGDWLGVVPLWDDREAAEYYASTCDCPAAVFEVRVQVLPAVTPPASAPTSPGSAAPPLSKPPTKTPSAVASPNLPRARAALERAHNLAPGVETPLKEATWAAINCPSPETIARAIEAAQAADLWNASPPENCDGICCVIARGGPCDKCGYEWSRMADPLTINLTPLALAMTEAMEAVKC
jgi:hypothetical protein